MLALVWGHPSASELDSKEGVSPFCVSWAIFLFVFKKGMLAKRVSSFYNMISTR